MYSRLEEEQRRVQKLKKERGKEDSLKQYAAVWDNIPLQMISP
jgi:hypothetical protein